MSEHDDLRRHIEAEARGPEAEEVVRLAERLRAERPVPRAAFRGELRVRLLRSPELVAWRPARLRLTIGAYLASGVALLAVAAIGVAGAGPLAHDDTATTAAVVAEPPYGSSTR
jgi:hypothetical protein